ncbi:hypothetical protein H4S08_002116 [Coemansia sp. RSA 1365]|nr:hypothetical protein H4S08_002116 [Coemansia sp. RSA 1365]
MPKRKVTNEDSSGTASSESEVSETGTPVLRRTRGRKSGKAGSSGARSTQSSPALNTRRASRLSVSADADDDSPKRRTRLTRGSRRGSEASTSRMGEGPASTTTATKARGGRGARGRGRAGSSRGRASRRGALTGGRGRRVRAKTEDMGLSSTSISDTEQDEDSTEDYAMLDKSEEEAEEEDEEPSDTSGVFDSLSADRDASEMESDPVSAATGSSGMKDDEEEDGQETPKDDAEGRSDDEEVESNAAATAPLKKRPRTDGRGSQRSADQLVESTESSAGEDALEADDISEHSGFSEGESELGVVTSTANLTRRQRARLTRDKDEELMELPVEAKRSKFSAEESALRKSEHARRRKFQSLQRAEQLKNDTINRLLNKQSSKGRNKVTEDSETRSTSVEAEAAAPENIRYIQRRSPRDADEGKSSDIGNGTAPVHIECGLSLPKDVTIHDLIPSVTDKGFVPSYPEPLPLCSVDGCDQKKKYNIESQAACSLEHWRVLKDPVGAVSKPI